MARRDDLLDDLIGCIASFDLLHIGSRLRLGCIEVLADFFTESVVEKVASRTRL